MSNGHLILDSKPDVDLQLLESENLDGGIMETYTAGNDVYHRYIFNDGREKWVCVTQFIEIEDED